ncbi:glycosyltransferase family 4 protein [Azospirillum halopraeferens]|uniref:glycosyltransferase family 4 protein n=1 Tax=Azospirillum halopraeferens TaxID=34010 RepID=UPI0003FF851B|nr:glycosyltransferase family 4 protein [Azospirillum halopraeferens]
MDQPAAPASAPSHATAAVLYHPEGFDASQAQVKGRHAAGAGFLKGLADHAAGEVFYCHTGSRGAYEDFHRRLAAWRGRPVETRWLHASRPAALAEPGCLFVPGPGLADYAWQRRGVDERAYSLCGVTHTVSSDRAMDALGSFLTAPVQEWDALICTTQSVRRACLQVIESYAAYLAERIGARPPLRPQLPVIPLGVDAAAFDRDAAGDAAAAALRSRLGLGPDDVAGLFFGRLSFHAKAHPVPMFMAFEQAQARLEAPRRLHLLLVGQFPNDGVEREIREAAARFCPSVPVHVLDGADHALARTSWFAADLFVSLSDNIQESFGLTPVEAMAAGLPCIVSDWDGYRETVIDGETGFTIPTLLPPPRAGADLAERYALGLDTYDRFIGGACLATAVDVAACAGALARLAGDRDLRRRMGDAGRRRAVDVFDWKHVIAAYQALWADLAERRRAAPLPAPRAAADPGNPLRADPFSMFRHHPTRTLAGTETVRIAVADPGQALERVLAGTINSFATAAILPHDVIRRLVAELEAGPRALGDILAPQTLAQRRLTLRTLVWLKKYAIVEL